MNRGKAATILRLVIPCACALMCASCGPHMIESAGLKPYDREMPPMQSGTVPTTGGIKAVTLRESRLTSNPLPQTRENRENGAIYYRYYCLMCHGTKGDGNGPVGEGYVPKPTDLGSPAIASLNDGELYYRMLTGTGHSPAMEETVIPEQRWPLVMYVRTFAALSPGQSQQR